jgi:hypothetical protein
MQARVSLDARPALLGSIPCRTILHPTACALHAPWGRGRRSQVVLLIIAGNLSCFLLWVERKSFYYAFKFG